MQVNKESIHHLIIDGLDFFGINAGEESWQYNLASALLLLALAIGAHVLTRFILHFKIVRLISMTKNRWDNELLEFGVFRRLAHLVPGLVIYVGKFSFFDEGSPTFTFVSVLVTLYLFFTVYMVLQSILSAGEAIYGKSELSRKAPITGFIQVARLLFTLALIFFVISLLLGKSPIYLLSGLTAIAAVLLLIFRDTILGFVAGIQIAANRMFNTGDWVELPKYGVDGEITQIGLTVVKVQNWDKTISTIPTYSLTSDAVKNWRGMQESGGRRIKRAIHIDMRSIKFANTEMLKEWRRFTLLQDYLKNKEDQLLADAKRCEAQASDLINSRKLTNLGTFRAYVSLYIKQHPEINQEMTCMVRQLKPSEVGLPLEIYCFSKNKAWVEYEYIQAEIFDHLLAIMPLFGLQAYQRVANDKPLESAVE